MRGRKITPRQEVLRDFGLKNSRDNQGRIRELLDMLKNREQEYLRELVNHQVNVINRLSIDNKVLNQKIARTERAQRREQRRLKQTEQRLQKRVEKLRQAAARPKAKKIPFYTITNFEPVMNQKFKQNELSSEIAFNNEALQSLRTFEELWKVFTEALRKVFETAVRGLHENDLVSVSISDTQHGHAWGVSQGFAQIGGYDLNSFLNAIEAKMQSWFNIGMESAISLTVKTIRLPRGGARKTILTADDYLKKKSITHVKGDDNLCLFRSFALAIARRNGDARLYDDIRKNANKQQKEAIKVAEAIGWTEERYEEYTGIEELEALEKAFGIKICVFEGKSLIYGSKGSEDVIFLSRHGNHFDFINNINGYFGNVHFCKTCFKGYDKDDKHGCNRDLHCNICGDKTTNHFVKDSNSWKKCDECNRSFPSAECFDVHLKSMCKKRYKCLKCFKLLWDKDVPRKEHKCYFANCENCGVYCDLGEHQCFMQKLQGESYEKKIDEDNKRMLYFFDFEATQVENDGEREHKVNLAIVQDINGKTWRFETIEDFCGFMLDRERENSIFVAHNMRGYDGHFIMQYCLRYNHQPFPIYSGNKIMSISLRKLNITVMDSLNFFGCKLSALPKMFGLKELCKGFFPHFFNTPENQNYVGSIPDPSFYGCDSMMSDDRKKFLEWHNKLVSENYVFDFAKEFYAYCLSDVDILRRGCMEFERLFREATGVRWSPWHNLTIASCCMRLYREKFMPERSIGIVNKIGEKVDTHSRESIVWLESLGNKNIKHAMNGREVRVMGRSVDGYDKETKTVYQYNGCYWHGCTSCYGRNVVNRYNNCCMADLSKDTANFEHNLKSSGFNVVSMWECEWKAMLAKDSELRDACNEIREKYVGKIKLSQALFGGRTESFVLHKKLSAMDLEKGLKIKYVDFRSLYPSVNKYGQYPVGHPNIIYLPELEKSQNLDGSLVWKGLVKCKMYPPKGLRFPVLPMKVDARVGSADKLMFALCSACANGKDNDACCNHSDEERALIGTWTHFEINKAIECGYVLADVYEVHHFENWTGELFADYVNCFLKIKQERSELPAWVKTEEDKDRYIENFFEAEGIRMEKENMEYNAGLRAISKLCLNSLWGKFGQRSNMSQTRYFDNYADFAKFLCNKRIVVENSEILGENVKVSYRDKDDCVKETKNTNAYIAIFTTAQARLKLYDLISGLDWRVLYCDTDSAIYIDDGNANVKCGDNLGELESAIGQEFITEYVGIGPKTYAYVLESGKGCCKMKGFTLNYKNAQKLNMQSMLKLLEDRESNAPAKIVIEESNIVTDKHHRVYTKQCTKTLQFEYDKRRICDDYITLPWGY
jgi:G:T-mismatch repair DNA endonuclease (very short patch repair protein)